MKLLSLGICGLTEYLWNAGRLRYKQGFTLSSQPTEQLASISED